MTTSRKQAGFSLIEVLVVIAIALVLGAAAVIQIWPSLRAQKAEVALQTTLGQIRNARQQAVDKRKHYRLTFTSPRTITIEEQNWDALSKSWNYSNAVSIDLPSETEFTAVSGIPTTSPPDGMSDGKTAVDFNIDNGGKSNELYFQPDGRILDSVNRINSGVIYLARPGELMSSRAVTVWGASGRAKGWKLVQNGSNLNWVNM